MVEILENIETIAGTLKKFLLFLGPNLKAVTSDSEGIDYLRNEVTALVIPFENFPYNVIYYFK